MDGIHKDLIRITYAKNPKNCWKWWNVYNMKFRAVAQVKMQKSCRELADCLVLLILLWKLNASVGFRLEHRICAHSTIDNRYTTKNTDIFPVLWKIQQQTFCIFIAHIIRQQYVSYVTCVSYREYLNRDVHALWCEAWYSMHIPTYIQVFWIGNGIAIMIFDILCVFLPLSGFLNLSIKCYNLWNNCFVGIHLNYS